MKTFRKTFYEPILFGEVLLDVGKNKGSHLAASVSYLDYEDKKGKMRKYKVHLDDPKDFYGLMHECIHLVRYIFVDRNIPITENNDEIFAYYHGYWFKKLWRSLSKFNK